MPCCCLELLAGKIYSVGNGYVTAPTSVSVSGCGEALVYINGSPPPVFVSDCEEITVTIELINQTCCTVCQQIDVQCAPCEPMAMTMAMTKTPLTRRKIDPRTGKTKINPNTGTPIIVINKNELIRRVEDRIRRSQRRNK